MLARLLREGSAVAQLDGEHHQLFPVAIGRADGEALHGWVTRKRVANSIEIGLGYAIAALFICDGLTRAASPTP